MKKVKLKIEGMHCSSCALLIDSDLEDVEGIKCSSTNYATSETEVEFDEEQLKLEKVIEVISKAGYSVKN